MKELILGCSVILGAGLAASAESGAKSAMKLTGSIMAENQISVEAPAAQAASVPGQPVEKPVDFNVSGYGQSQSAYFVSDLCGFLDRGCIGFKKAARFSAESFAVADAQNQCAAKGGVVIKGPFVEGANCVKMHNNAVWRYFLCEARASAKCRVAPN